MASKFINSFQLLNLKNEVFTTYCIWAGLLIIKMSLMSFLTGIQRFRKKAAVSKEDTKTMPKGTEVRVDESVERIRRAHQNDLENILPYLIIGFLYIMSDPNRTAATSLYHVGGAARFFHTLFYVFIPFPPLRFMSFFTTALIMKFMAVSLIVYVCQ